MSNKKCGTVRAVFSLNHPVKSNLFRVSLFICKNNNFTRACRQTCVNMVCKNSLCGSCITVTRSNYLMTLRNCFSTVCNGCNGLNTADFIYFSDTDYLCRSQNSVVNFTFFIRRCYNNNLRNFRNNCRYTKHTQN